MLSGSAVQALETWTEILWDASTALKFLPHRTSLCLLIQEAFLFQGLTVFLTCHMQNAASLFAINQLYEVWDLNTISSTGSTKSKALFEWQKGISREAGISLELLALYPGGRNGSKPLSQPEWQNNSIGPPVPLSTTAFMVCWILFTFPL